MSYRHKGSLASPSLCPCVGNFVISFWHFLIVNDYWAVVTVNIYRKVVWDGWYESTWLVKKTVLVTRVWNQVNVRFEDCVIDRKKAELNWLVIRVDKTLDNALEESCEDDIWKFCLRSVYCNKLSVINIVWDWIMGTLIALFYKVYKINSGIF